MSEHQADEKAQLFNKMRILQGKKQKMDKLLGELHTLRDQHLNNSSCKSVQAESYFFNEYNGFNMHVGNVLFQIAIGQSSAGDKSRAGAMSMKMVSMLYKSLS